MRLLTETYRVNLPNDLLQKVRSLKQFRIVPAKFIRQAIEEKFEREYQNILIKSKRKDLPF